MLKHFDSSLSFITNETKIALYIEIAKPLILTLPDINDKVKAIAWFRKIIFDNSSLLVRIEYLELLLKFLKQRKLSGFFAGLPDTRRPLQKLNKRRKTQKPVSRCDHKTDNFIGAPSKSVDNDVDNYLPQKTNCNTFKYKYMEVVHHVNKLEHNTQCYKRNNRISAGYSPFTKTEIQHEIKNIMNSPGDDNEKINKCKAMLTNCLPPRTTSDLNESIRLGHSKPAGRGKREKYFNMYNATPDFENFNSKFPNVFCKRKDKCVNRTDEYLADEKIYQHVRGKNNKTIENVPIKAKLKEENKQNKELDQYYDQSKNSKLNSFLVGSKKYLTLCVSKECLVERNIFKCVKYIITNAQCKFFKFKEYTNFDKNYSNTKLKKTSDLSRNNHANAFINNETRRKTKTCSNSYAPENNKTFFFDNSYLSRLRNLLSDNITFANASNLFRNMVGKCVYIKISLILAVGTIFFWKIYQVIFACQCKRVGYSAKLVSQISNYRKNPSSSYVFTFVGCFILYQFLKDFFNIFFEPY